MLARLDYQEGRDVRAELDNLLGVAGWRTPGRELVAYTHEAGTPSWWSGDEEASQTFLRAQGVRT